MTEIKIITVEVRYEEDVVLARQRSRFIAEALGFETQDQTRIATAVSEIARNAFQYGNGGRVEFWISNLPQQFTAQQLTAQKLTIVVSDRGSGIADIDAVLNGTTSGQGILGARRLMDSFEVQSVGGTQVKMSKAIAAPISRDCINQIAQDLMIRSPQNPYEELQRQNQELLRTLDRLQQREAELAILNRELEETNRGVVALYGELDVRANSLQESNEIKTRFLSNMSHEFRTPVNSILSLTRLLLDRLDGELSSEQETQVVFIRKAADSLSELVNDLLDLAKVEAGKVEVRAIEFEVSELIGTLRGMLRPLLPEKSPVSLIFEDVATLPKLYTDDSKLAQILRNLISNAIKYTDWGEVRVSVSQSFDRVNFSVADTGIGIAPEDLTRIFEDFVQIDSSHQKRIKGTGLGLPLSRKLAELLGGSLSVESTIGAGSTFAVSIPIVYSAIPADFPPQERSPASITNSKVRKANPLQTILIIDDDSISRYLIKQALSRSNLTIVEATTAQEGLDQAKRLRPEAIILDLSMPISSGFEVLDQLKVDAVTRSIPVIIHTACFLTSAELALLQPKAAAILYKDSGEDSISGDLKATIVQLGLASGTKL